MTQSLQELKVQCKQWVLKNTWKRGMWCSKGTFRPDSGMLFIHSQLTVKPNVKPCAAHKHPEPRAQPWLSWVWGAVWVVLGSVPLNAVALSRVPGHQLLLEDAVGISFHGVLGLFAQVLSWKCSRAAVLSRPPALHLTLDICLLQYLYCSDRAGAQKFQWVNKPDSVMQAHPGEMNKYCCPKSAPSVTVSRVTSLGYSTCHWDSWLEIHSNLSLILAQESA